jgi:hypothetical protein
MVITRTGVCARGVKGRKFTDPPYAGITRSGSTVDGRC